MADLLRGRGPQLTGMVEIARSFSYKLNAGNFESRDFFCSQKAECHPADAEAVSDKLYQFCKTQVMKAVSDYLALDRARREAQPTQRRTA